MSIRLGEILLKKRLVTKEQLDSALEEHKKTGKFLGEILLKMGYIKEEGLLNVLSEQLGIAYVKLREIIIDEAVIKRVPAKFAQHYEVMPIRFDDNILTVAVSNPLDMWPIDDIEINLGYRVERVLSGKDDILWAIKKYYGVGAETIERILAGTGHEGKKVRPEGEEEGAGEGKKVEDIEKSAGDASVIKLVNQILQQAIHDGATDLHIEPFRTELILRYRIDGVLYETPVSEDIRYLYSSIISRIKIMAGLDIVERRLPQDGRAKVKVGEKEYDLRISILPSLYGEDVVIRILPTRMLFNLETLGFSRRDFHTLNRLLEKPYGVIFVSGPTGSGKTTTLYACLNKLNTSRRKIITIEDPVEYELKKVNQIQINPKINLTFARALRSMLRHDPDILMVGEVRDPETAKITIQASLTGHLVFSTVHTKDAAGAATRLIDMGVEPYLIVSSVEAFIAQRLVRLVCPKCKEKVEIDKAARRTPRASGVERTPLDSKHPTGRETRSVKRVFRGKGCEACRNTGYKGRTAIYEILSLTDPIKKLIMKKASSDEIRRKAVSMGMKTLRDDGWQKVSMGMTTPDEVMRVTQLEE
ncbi:MAG: GspE/PulE family protein [Candidatus Omnitrophota bacterium]|nr:GspE/PulE family protein [Candidatus Omnitrophota bacterium]